MFMLLVQIPAKIGKFIKTEIRNCKGNMELSLSGYSLFQATEEFWE